MASRRVETHTKIRLYLEGFPTEEKVDPVLANVERKEQVAMLMQPNQPLMNF